MFQDYLSHASIHGLRYLASDGRGPVRTIWAVFVSASFGLASVLVEANLCN